MNYLFNKEITRRHFLRKLLLGSAIMSGTGVSDFFSTSAFASHIGVSVPKTLVNIMLLGGADFRFVVAPAPLQDPVYANQFWVARRNLYNNSYSSYADMFSSEYTLHTDPLNPGFTFGIHNSAGWLSSQFSLGNVAIIANTYASLNRRHDHSQLMVQTGDLSADRTNLNREGWGGRLVEAMAAVSNVIELSGEVQLFCNGSDEAYRLANVVHTQDVREFGLRSAVLGSQSRDDVQIRALTAYYAERGPELLASMPDSWPYRKFFEHHDSVRAFGDLIKARLADHPLPLSLSEPAFNLNSRGFQTQCRNLYDVCLAPDILKSRLLSMSYGGWDTHTDQTIRMLSSLSDVLGTGGGLDTVMTQLASDVPTANSNIVFTLPWDFGRQLASNGSVGTDHGRANDTILIGAAVQGGIHGELFPVRESIPDPQDSQGRTPFEIDGRDIDGLTSLQHVWARICEWLEPGTANTVFPDYQNSPLEPGVNLTNLF